MNYSECSELKSIKYKLNGIPWPENKSSNDLSDIDNFLEKEKIFNSNEPWSKLDKTAKIRKLIAFSEKYKEENQLSDEEHARLIAFFKDCLDKKKLQRLKDVIYNKDIGEIIEIPALILNKTSNNFTLKNIDKRVSTIRGLTPKKKTVTAKHKSTHHDSDSQSDNEM